MISRIASRWSLRPWPACARAPDGQAVACDDNGVTSFNRIRYRRHDESIFLYAFDLIELNGTLCGMIRLKVGRPRTNQGWAWHPLQ
jgi:hypothetical protein